MKLIVAGKDRSIDLGDDIAREAVALARSNTILPCGHDDSVLHLRDGASMAEYLQTYASLMRINGGLRIALTTPPRPPRRGLMPRLRRWLRPLLLRVLTHEHAYIVHQQATFNELMATALEFEVAESQRRCTEIENRLAALEARCADAHRPTGVTP